MTAALTPALALDYLHALSADLRAAVVLDARGERLAGPPALAEAARALLAPGSALLEGSTDAGAAFAARDERHVLVAVTGPHVLPGLTGHDLTSTLAALGGGDRLDAPSSRLSHATVSALLRAADDGFRRPRAV
jgi:hypothetical protein